MECAGVPPGLLKALGRLMMPKKEGKFRVIFNTQQTLPWLIDWLLAAGRANVQRLKCFRPIVIGRSEDVAGKLTTKWWYFVEQSHVCT